MDAFLYLSLVAGNKSIVKKLGHKVVIMMLPGA